MAITSAFNKRTLQRFLDEELELNLDNLVREDDFHNTVWELIKTLQARGTIDAFMKKWMASDEFGGAPALLDLRQSWPLLSDQPRRPPESPAGPGRSPEAPTPAQIEPPAGAKGIQSGASALTGDHRQKGDVESILDDNVNRMPAAAWMKGVAAVSRQVCRIQSGRGPIGTGFLVGPRHVMTAAHVANQLFDDPGPREAVFDLDAGSLGGEAVPIEAIVAAQPSNLADGLDPRTDWFQSLDFALLELGREPPAADGGPRGWIDLGGYRSRLHPGEAVTTLYYPASTGLTLAQGAVVRGTALSGRVGHDADTMPGGSGAPVFDARLKLIGIQEAQSLSIAEIEGGSYAVRADAVARELEALGIALPRPPAED